MIFNNSLKRIASILLLVLLTACSSATDQPNANETIQAAVDQTRAALPVNTDTPTTTFTPQPTETTIPTATIVRTPPALPSIYTSPALNAKDYPHTYISDTCEYLRMKWDANNSSPGTVVMVIMFHSIIKAGGEIPPNGIGHGQFQTMMKTLHDQGFEAINMEQLVNFMEKNAKIPERSILLLVDDRHFEQYFDNFFLPYYEEYGWPVINAWISHPEQTAAGLWEENEKLAAEGWVDYQSHGVIHNIPITEASTDEYIMTELQGSIDFIQEHYNKTPIAFIWPGGNFTQRGVQLARYVGYQVGFTVNPRGPIMFNWVPLSDQADPQRPSYLPEGQVNDPLMVLPRYWPSDVMNKMDSVRIIGKEAAAYAEENRPVELEYYDIVCSPTYGPIPTQTP